MADPSDREKVEKVLERLVLETSQGLLCLYCAEWVYEGSQRSPLHTALAHSCDACLSVIS